MHSLHSFVHWFSKYPAGERCTPAGGRRDTADWLSNVPSSAVFHAHQGSFMSEPMIGIMYLYYAQFLPPTWALNLYTLKGVGLVCSVKYCAFKLCFTTSACSQGLRYLEIYEPPLRSWLMSHLHENIQLWWLGYQIVTFSPKSVV